MRLSDVISKNDVSGIVLYDEDMKVGFDLVFLQKRKLQEITASNTKMKSNPKTHVMEEVMDAEAVRKEICALCVKGWVGMTYKWLSKFIPVDFTQVKPEDELPFTQDNLKDLMDNMYGLDGWVFESVKNAANFKDEATKAELKN